MGVVTVLMFYAKHQLSVMEKALLIKMIRIFIGMVVTPI